MVRKATAISLLLVTFFFTVVAILGIWDLIPAQKVLWNSIYSMVVLFMSSLLMLFIFSVIYKGDDAPAQRGRRVPPNPSGNPGPQPAPGV